MIIRDTTYHPDVVSIPSDRRVRLVVDRREADPCSNQIAVPQLGVLADLRLNAVTVVDLPAMKAGVYTMTCGMGMMSGRIESGPPPAAAPSLLLIASIALGVTVTALALARRRKSRRSPHGG
jgi:plastocyanin domain-containing protein